MTQDLRIRLSVDSGNLPQATAAAEKAVARIGVAAQTSAKQTAFAMRQLPAQFTDVVTQLAGGANPLIVLLQQGGQIKDSFGGVGAALRGVAAALSPVTIAVGAAAAAVGGLVAALVMGSRESAHLRDTIALTGNAAGLTADRLTTLADRVTEKSEQTTGAARDIVLALADTGRVGSRVMDSAAVAVARLADLTGKDAKEIAGDFARMQDGVARWAAEHNKAWHFITDEQYRYIKRLEDQGNAEQAMIVTNQALTRHLEDQARNLGTLERAWLALKQAISGTIDAALAFGRETTTRAELDIQMNRLAALGGNLGPRAKAALEQRIQFLKEQLKLERQQADARSGNASANAAAIQAQIEADKVKPAAAAKGKPYIPSEFGVFDRWDAAVLAARREKIDSEQQAFFDAQLRAQDERDARRMQQAEEYLQGLRDANARAGAEMLADERQRATALIEIDRQAALRRLQAMNLQGAAAEGARAEIDAAAATARAKLDREEEQRARRRSEQLSDSIAEGLLDGFRRGGNFADVFLAELKAQFAKTVLSPIIRPTVEAGNELIGSILKGAMSLISGAPVEGLPAGSDLSQFWDMGPVPGRAGGGRVRPGSLVRVGEHGPELLLMGAAGGTVIPSGQSVRGGGVQVTYAPTTRIDARADQAQIAQMVATANAAGQRQLLEMLRAKGVMR